jgi:hypothetical protein
VEQTANKSTQSKQIKPQSNNTPKLLNGAPFIDLSEAINTAKPPSIRVQPPSSEILWPNNATTQPASTQPASTQPTQPTQPPQPPQPTQSITFKKRKIEQSDSPPSKIPRSD